MRRWGTSVGRSRRQRDDDEDRILPLINIVFLLLIFFMVVGRLSAGDPFEIQPPYSRSNGAPANEPTLVSIGEDGQLALNGALIAEDALLAQVGQLNVPEIRIKSDGRVEALRVVALMNQFRALGIQSVRLMTVPDMSGSDTGGALAGVAN
ncbi:MAG: biopolymer transporter ExbD [Pseudomonadota bacterium]